MSRLVLELNKVFMHTILSRPTRGGGGRGGKIPGARTGLGTRNLDKTSGHCATVKRVGAP